MAHLDERLTMKLHNIFAKTLSVPVETIRDDLQYNSIKEWDSVAHMALVAALEEEYDIMLDTDDVIDMSSVAKAREILSKYGVAV